MVFGLFFFGTAAGSRDGAVRRGRMGFSSRLIQGQGKTDQGAVLRVRLTRILLRQGPRSAGRSFHCSLRSGTPLGAPHFRQSAAVTSTDATGVIRATCVGRTPRLPVGNR
jgi:hypothetical protein